MTTALTPRPILRLTRAPRGMRGFTAATSHDNGAMWSDLMSRGANPRSYWRWYASFYRYTLQEVRYGRRARVA